MGRITVRQDKVTMDKSENENTLFNFYDGKKLVATINVFPTGNVFIWEATKVFTKIGQEIEVE